MGDVDRWSRVYPAIEQQMSGSDHFPTFRSEVSAFASYGAVSLYDIKNPLDAYFYSKAFGVSYAMGLAIAYVGGFVLMGTIGYLVDPLHKSDMPYALDEQWFYGTTHREGSYDLEYFR